MNKKHFAVLRICFGFVWLIDAVFKWQHAFLNNFTGYLTSAMQGQPPLIADWIHLWIRFVSVDPHLFAVITALLETAIALALIFGWMTRPTIVIGIILSLVIWTTAEGLAVRIWLDRRISVRLSYTLLYF